MKNLKKALIISITALILIVSVIVYLSVPKELHEHADFAVFINNERVNFSSPKYMSDQTLLSERVHLHDMEERVLHKHDKEVRWSEFFITIGMNLNNTCFSINGRDYCNNETHLLKVFSNTNEITDIENYEVKDLDRVLITYGTGEHIDEQIKSVSDIACVFSNKCPEKGQAVGEGCVTGGTSCS